MQFEVVSTKLRDKFNIVLEKHNSGYRIVYNYVIPISSKEEMGEIKEVFTQEDLDNNVKEHIDTSIKHFTNKENPDYRNSIKESISAVESLLKVITGKDNITLGQGLALYNKKEPMNHNLKQAFDNLYKNFITFAGSILMTIMK